MVPPEHVADGSACLHYTLGVVLTQQHGHKMGQQPVWVQAEKLQEQSMQNDEARKATWHKFILYT